jgi:hypothetical protein
MLPKVITYLSLIAYVWTEWRSGGGEYGERQWTGRRNSSRMMWRGSIYVASYRNLGIDTNFFAEIAKVLFLNRLPLSPNKTKYDYSLGPNFRSLVKPLFT